MYTLTYTLEDLLPHRPPMILLEAIEDYTSNSVKTSLHICPFTRFYEDYKGVPSYVGIEYMAQTCGVYAGLNALNQGQHPRLGFLLGSRNFTMHEPYFTEGMHLIISATKVFHENGIGVFDCRIDTNEKLVASARLNLYQPEDPLIFLKKIKEGTNL